MKEIRLKPKLEIGEIVKINTPEHKDRLWRVASHVGDGYRLDSCDKYDYAEYWMASQEIADIIESSDEPECKHDFTSSIADEGTGCYLCKHCGAQPTQEEKFASCKKCNTELQWFDDRLFCMKCEPLTLFKKPPVAEKEMDWKAKYETLKERLDDYHQSNIRLMGIMQAAYEPKPSGNPFKVGDKCHAYYINSCEDETRFTGVIVEIIDGKIIFPNGVYHYKQCELVEE